MEGCILKLLAKGIAFALLACTGQYALAQTTAENPSVAPDPATLRSGSEVYTRIRNALNPTSCTPKASKSTWMKAYIHRPERFQQQLAEMLPVLDHVSFQAAQRSLPMEFALIPFVESRFQPDAVAKGGPKGLWQLMPLTAKHFGLKIGGNKDERMDYIQATDAALSYLEQLQKQFGDWPTSIMAYNAGDSRLRLSLKRQKLDRVDAENRLPKGLAPHTYAYVRKIQALSCFMQNPESFGVRLPEDTLFTPLASDFEVEIPDNGN